MTMQRTLTQVAARKRSLRPWESEGTFTVYDHEEFLIGLCWCGRSAQALTHDEVRRGVTRSCQYRKCGPDIDWYDIDFSETQGKARSHRWLYPGVTSRWKVDECLAAVEAVRVGA